MARYAVLLRGINIGPRNRIAMPALREALRDAGFEEVATYVQSGNVVLTSSAKAETVGRKVEAVISDAFGLEIAVVVRTASDLKRIRQANPLGKVATNPKRYQVTFLDKKLPAAKVRELEELCTDGEQVVARGREVYAWTPDGIARSKLWAKLAGNSLGVTATSRNWTTVEALLELAGG
ncbi:MAG TPA: DUF1697 domain-containing protein [Gaiellaceae bacterium]|nr:DUF1697 domain-containing protein [Gaiellaceae bacterium]